jgi:hypothetical protein
MRRVGAPGLQLGYRLPALRAWGHGSVGREAAWVCRDRTRFFSVSVRYRSRFRSRFRRVRRGVAGRAPCPPGACRVGMLGMATTDTLAAYPIRVPGRCRGDRVLAFRGRGSVAPLGLGSHKPGTPTAHAVGYCLSALRAWGHGLGTGLVGRFRVVGVLCGETSTFEPLPRCGACGCFNPSGVVFRFPWEPGGALRDPGLSAAIPPG